MRFRLSMTLIVAVVGVATWAATSLNAADDPLASLNRAIQERFKDVDKNFGLRRIVVIGDTPHQFRPETVSEFAAVQELKDEGLHVALYMAGRRVLDREPDLTTKQPFTVNRRVIFGPIAVTDPAALSALPGAVDLIDESRQAFQALQRRERFDFETADWTFSARAVRAASTECLTCHKGRAVGDPLGVVLYAYRHVSSAQ
jgi:hypothetical protein